MKKIIVKTFYFLGMMMIFFFQKDFVAYADKFDNYLNFNNITTNDGLSQGSIDDIFQDSDGYMWFATNDGLNRYDGHEFKVFKGDINDVNSIWPGLVSCISEDKNGYLWVGTGGGLAKIDRKTLMIERVYVDKADTKKITSQNIIDILRDSKDNMWVATDDGLNFYDYSTKEFKKFLTDDINVESKKEILVIEEDANEKILVGLKNEGLRELDLKSKKFVAYQNKEKNLLNNRDITAIHKDINNQIWVTTSTGEIFKLNNEKKELELEIDLTKEFNDDKLFVKSMSDDFDGNIWFGTNKALYKYYPENKKFFKYTNKPYDLSTLVNNTILDVYRDKSGLMWIGTINGISKVNPKQSFINYKKRFGEENTLSGKSISGIYEDEYGDLWIGTVVDGLNKLERETDIYTHYKYNENLENSIVSNYIWQVTGDGKGDVWAATKDGISKINIKTNKITNYTHDPNDKTSLSNNDVREIFIDKKGYVWIGTRNGLDVYDPKTDTFTNINQIILNSGINELFVRRIFQDLRGDYWLAIGWNSGLLKIDASTGDVKIYNHNSTSKTCLSDNMVMDINQGLNGDIWVATTNGLNKIDINTDEIIDFKEEKGLVNSYVYGILVDDFGNIWVSTNGGISKYDILTNNFENYTYMDGLQGNEFNVISKFKSNDGEMFFGGVDGLSSFIPSNITKGQTLVGNVIINKMHVYKNKNIVYDKNVILNYQENNFTINFVLPEYRDTRGVSYEYILEGFDKSWVLAEDRREAIYTNIPPGNYNFKVRAKLKSGIYTKENKFNININKPWYSSNLAIVIYLIIIIIIIFVCINYVKILDGLIKQKTLQLNAQILAKDKLHEEKENLYKELLRYEKFRNTYLVNLSHELRTPLNVILSTEQLINSLNKNKEEIKKDRLSKYMKIIHSNSKNLLEVINDLIDSSRVKSGAYKIEFKKHDIVYLVEEVALSMKTFVEEEGLELIIDPEIEEKVIECSKKDIERCVINLISNAVKFTEQGTIYIGIKEIPNYVEISVKDSGKGISKEDQSIIFDRFTQIEDGISSKHCSSGIGLNLVKDFVELHKGNITLISELGQGSEFIIRLPIEMKKEG
ncbi:MAG: ligand-binding sensor domain-containing protein [Sarcina sp.]